MGLVYLPTIYQKILAIHVRKYTSPMDPFKIFYEILGWLKGDSYHGRFHNLYRQGYCYPILICAPHVWLNSSMHLPYISRQM